MLAAAPSGFGGGPPAAATMAPANAGPATSAPVPALTDQSGLETPTPDVYVMTAPEAPLPGTERKIQPPSSLRTQPEPLNPWVIIWPSLAILLGAVAVLVRWLNSTLLRAQKPSRMISLQRLLAKKWQYPSSQPVWVILLFTLSLEGSSLSWKFPIKI